MQATGIDIAGMVRRAAEAADSASPRAPEPAATSSSGSQQADSQPSGGGEAGKGRAVEGISLEDLLAQAMQQGSQGPDPSQAGPTDSSAGNAAPKAPAGGLGSMMGAACPTPHPSCRHSGCAARGSSRF